MLLILSLALLANARRSPEKQAARNRAFQAGKAAARIQAKERREQENLLVGLFADGDGEFDPYGEQSSASTQPEVQYGKDSRGINARNRNHKTSEYERKRAWRAQMEAVDAAYTAERVEEQRRQAAAQRQLANNTRIAQQKQANQQRFDAQREAAAASEVAARIAAEEEASRLRNLRKEEHERVQAIERLARQKEAEQKRAIADEKQANLAALLKRRATAVADGAYKLRKANRRIRQERIEREQIASELPDSVTSEQTDSSVSSVARPLTSADLGSRPNAPAYIRRSVAELKKVFDMVSKQNACPVKQTRYSKVFARRQSM